MEESRELRILCLETELEILQGQESALQSAILTCSPESKENAQIGLKLLMEQVKENLLELARLRGEQ
jgi:hypothetical protein